MTSSPRKKCVHPLLKFRYERIYPGIRKQVSSRGYLTISRIREQPEEGENIARETKMF